MTALALLMGHMHHYGGGGNWPWWEPVLYALLAIAAIAGAVFWIFAFAERRLK